TGGGPAGKDRSGWCSAAFFCLLFFAAAKKSRCRPAQGQRKKNQYEIADAIETDTNKTANPTPAARQNQNQTKTKIKTKTKPKRNPSAPCAPPHAP
ncbi:hypothetical protein, partial [Paraburkholderia sp. C35]|uniref:hypothetical protein n=1 Tax=Paraburkholderia sp. C35 TaxID=2126993 RepID=UPI0019526A6C